VVNVYVFCLICLIGITHSFGVIVSIHLYKIFNIIEIYGSIGSIIYNRNNSLFRYDRKSCKIGYNSNGQNEKKYIGNFFKLSQLHSYRKETNS
jgi:hypothetical protein